VGKSQRRKGSTGEREIDGILTDGLGIVVQRNLDQTRSGGTDHKIKGPNKTFKGETKRRRRLAVHGFMEQAKAACEPNEIALVFMRGDGKPWCVMMELEDFIPMLRDAL